MSGGLTTVEDALTSTPLPVLLTVSRAIAADFKMRYRTRFGDVDTLTLAEAIQDVIERALPDRVALSTVRPDFDNALLRLMQALESTDAWKDTSLASTGQMFLRAVATDIEYAQFSIVRALQEAFPHTARNPSSILAAARANGVRIQRSLPAAVPVRLVRQDTGLPYSLPPFTSFQINGKSWFNREQINWDTEAYEAETTLYAGVVNSEIFVSSGTPLLTLEIGEEDYAISDVDLAITVDGVAWPRTESSLFNRRRDDTSFWEQTLPNGNVEIRFGDGVHGASPPSGAEIEVIWATTGGAADNDAQGTYLVEMDDPPSGVVIEGQTLGPATGGNDRLSIDYYRIFTGDRRAADAGNAKRAIRRPDFRAHACAFPGVFDAVFRGQAELNPTKRSWMMIQGVTLLTSPVWTNDQWEEFIRYIRPLTYDNFEFIRLDPVPVVINVRGTIGCRMNTDRENTKQRVISNVRTALAPHIGSLFLDKLYTTDISNLLRGQYPKTFEYAGVNREARVSGLPEVIEWVKLDIPDTDFSLFDPTPTVPLVADNPNAGLVRQIRYPQLGTIDLETEYSTRGGYGGKRGV